MYIYTPLCRYWIALYRYVLVFIVPHVDIELEDNKQFISNIPRTYIEKTFKNHLIWNQKARAFDTWYIASPSEPLPRLFKL